MSHRLLIAIIDNVTSDIVGPIHLHRHESAALRMFDDAAKDERTWINKHIDDHELWSIGQIDDDTLVVEPHRKILITGKAWRAVQAQQQENKE